jgi:hypothetical protein
LIIVAARGPSYLTASTLAMDVRRKRCVGSLPPSKPPHARYRPALGLLSDPSGTSLFEKSRGVGTIVNDD